MEQFNHVIGIIALTMGAGWASGINLYAAIMTLGVLGATGSMTLPADLQILTHPAVIGASGLMFCVEFFADKIPGLDSSWDALHTFIRIPGGALLAAGAVGDVNPALTLAAAIIGGGLAAGSHLTKAGSRVVINASPEPISNWAASLAEDAAVVAGIWTALHYPLVFIGFLLAFALLGIWLLPKIWRGIRRVFSALTRLFGGRGARVSELPAPVARPRLTV
jgi:hypothetical protein